MPSTIPGSSAKKVGTTKGKKKAKRKEEEAERKAEEAAAEENETEFQKALLEVRVKELETLNLGLKRKSDYLESQNETYKAQLGELRIEKEELVAYLERSWKEEKNKVKYFEEKVNVLTETNAIHTNNYDQKLVQKQLELDELKEKLEKQILDLELQLTRIDTFRMEKDDLHKKLIKMEQTLAKERKENALKYEELENEIIQYKEKIKMEAVEMLLEISKDVQKAGKLCLTGAVKAAIAANVHLREELETVSKDNLTLRDLLQASSLNLQKVKGSVMKLEKRKALERKTCLQFKKIVQILLEKQTEMDQKIKNVDKIEMEFAQLQKFHQSCKTNEEIQQLISSTTQEFQEENSGIKDSKISLLESELRKIQKLILKVAVTTKDLTQARNVEEFEFLCQRLKVMLGVVHEAACGFQNLSPEMKVRLTMDVPPVTPYFKFPAVNN